MTLFLWLSYMLTVSWMTTQAGPGVAYDLWMYEWRAVSPVFELFSCDLASPPRDLNAPLATILSGPLVIEPVSDNCFHLKNSQASKLNQFTRAVNIDVCYNHAVWKNSWCKS